MNIQDAVRLLENRKAKSVARFSIIKVGESGRFIDKETLIEIDCMGDGIQIKNKLMYTSYIPSVEDYLAEDWFPVD